MEYSSIAPVVHLTWIQSCMHFTCWREIAPSTGRKCGQLQPKPGRASPGTKQTQRLVTSKVLFTAQSLQPSTKSDILTFDFVSLSNYFWTPFPWWGCEYVEMNAERLQSKHILILMVLFQLHCGGAQSQNAENCINGCDRMIISASEWKESSWITLQTVSMHRAQPV